MFEAVAKPFRTIKNRAVEALARKFFNREFAALGAVSRLQLDSKNKTLQIELLLKGETAPVTLWGPYAVSFENGAAFISFPRVTASREWLGAALNQYVAGRKLQIPIAVGRLL